MHRLIQAIKDVARGGPLKLRSPHWHATEKRWLETHGTCAACGSKERLQVHHVLSFHEHPNLELADGTGQFGTPVGVCNFITLCEEKGGPECHLHIGHTVNGVSSWKLNNPTVREDAAKAYEIHQLKHL